MNDLVQIQRKCGCDPSCEASAETGLRRSLKKTGESAAAHPAPRRGLDLTAVPLQAKLSLSRPGDACEREADAVADMFLGDAPIAVKASPAQPVTQRQEAAGETEEETEPADAETEGLDEEEDGIVGDESGFPKRRPAAAVIEESVLPLQRENGKPLEQSARQLAQQRFATDFSAVRVHHDADAARAAKRMNAEAFTVGSHIYFGAGGYQPTASSGLQLLAHELTHVVQQRHGTAISLRRRRRRGSTCGSGCAPSSARLHDGCNRGSPAVNDKRFIQHLQVGRAAHAVEATWSDGTSSNWPCSPSTRRGRGGKVPTPLGNDVVGIKCDSQHTNRHGDGMGWFTGFSSHARAIGFHNSQLVGPSHESHGCVRVCCDVAHTIRDNTSSGVTTITVVA